MVDHAFREWIELLPGGALIFEDEKIYASNCVAVRLHGASGQVDNPLTKDLKGTGLGLPLSKSLIEAHGGLLEIDSAPGEDTTVRICLPEDQLVPQPPPEIRPTRALTAARQAWKASDFGSSTKSK